MAAELLCKSHLPSVSWLHFHDYIHKASTNLQAGLCVVGFQAGSPASLLKQPVLSQRLKSMILLPLLLPAAGCLRRQESSLWSLGNLVAEITDSFSPGSQLDGFSPWKSFSAELHPISHPELNSWTVDNTASPSPLFSAWILLTFNLLKAQEIWGRYFTWKQ